MHKNPLIGVSIIAVVLLVLGSLTNVVGYQAVQSSNQKAIHDEVDQKELLFQTIVDIANNREIQRVILNSEIRRERFFNPDTRTSVFTPHVLTKTELNTAYNIGLILSKTFSKSKMHSLLEQHQMIPQGLQKEITAIIEKDATLNGEIKQLSNSKCNCENNSGVTAWPFPVICTILNILLVVDFFLIWYLNMGAYLGVVIAILMSFFNCPYW